MTAAVTPVPQLLIIGLAGSMFLLWKTLRSSSGGSKALVFGSSSSGTGTLIEPGMWPDERPAVD